MQRRDLPGQGGDCGEGRAVISAESSRIAVVSQTGRREEAWECIPERGSANHLFPKMDIDTVVRRDKTQAGSL